MVDDSPKVSIINILDFLIGVIIVVLFSFVSFWIMFVRANRIGALLSSEHFDFDKILLLCGIGISLILSALLWIFLRKTLLKRISILKLSVNLFVVFALLCSILLLTGFLSDQWAKKFTVEKWNTYSQIREDSMSDFHRNYKIKGMTKEQIVDLLGSNDMYMKHENGYDVYYYVIGQFLIATDYFRIYMKDNIVEKFDNYRD